MSERPHRRLRQVADRCLVVLVALGAAGLALLLWFAVARARSTPGAGALAPAAIGAALLVSLAFFPLRRRLYARVAPERLLVLVAGLGLPVVAVEAIANLTNARGYQYFANSQRYFRWQRYAGIPQSHAHPPDSTIELPWGTVRTNREGWRTPDVPEQPAPGTLRVLALGDSVVFGWGVPDEATLCVQLEGWLRERLGRGPLKRYRHVEVLNTGNGSYDSLDELLVLESRGLAYHPDLAYLLVIDNDFVRPAYRDEVDYLAALPPHDPDLIPTLRATQVERPPRIGPAGQPWRSLYGGVSYLLNRSFLVISAASALRGARASSAPSPPPAGPAGPPATSGPAKTAPARAPTLEALRGRYPYLKEQVACLREVARACRAAKVPLVLSVFAPSEPRLVAALRAALHGLTPVLELTYPEGQDPRGFANSITDPHWNRAGNAWFAQQVGARLLEVLAR